MTNLFIYLPFIISFLIGFFLIEILLNKDSRLNIMLHLVLGGGLGLGINAHITFFSFILMEKYSQFFVSGINLFILTILSLIFFKNSHLEIRNPKIFDIASYFIIFIFLIPLLSFVKLYPLGGWDAWSVWNFKAKFLFLSGENWTNIFSPILWRSSPHYPLLLPMINIWGWAFINTPADITPQITSIIFTILTMLLLFTGLKDLIKSKFAILAPISLLSIPYFMILASSQYCDIAIGYYLLASLYCLIKAKHKKSKKIALLGGFFLGLLSFTKPEGLVSAIIIIFCSFIYFLWKENSKNKKKLISFLLIGTLIFSIPSLIFQIFYAPENQTMINGLFSKTNPSTFLRLKTVIIYSLIELKSKKWDYLLVLLLLGLIFSLGRCFNKKILILPLYFFIYGIAVVLYYFINTQFEITWWLENTLSRLLFSVLPSLVFWAFYSLWIEEKSA